MQNPPIRITMKEYTFTFELQEQREALPCYLENDMYGVEVEVKYTVWKSGSIMLNEVKVKGVDIYPVLMAVKAEKFFESMAADDYEGRKVEQMAKNYPELAKNHTPSERREMQRIK
jgi:hypothetical protein